MSEIPSDSQGRVLNSLTLYYTVTYINSSDNKRVNWSHKERVSIVNGTASHSASFHGRDSVRRTVAITFDKSTKHLTATVNDAYMLNVTCVYYEFLVTANAPTFMYGSLASDGSIGGFSVAMGANLNAAGDYQLVTGKWNANDSNNLFEIGNGTGDTNRSTAFSVDDEGNVLAAGDYKAAGERLDYDFISVNSPFQLLYCHARRFGGMIHLSMEIFISSAFVANYRYTVGTIASDYVPRDIEVGTGHSTDSSYNPVGSVTWIANTNGDMQISLQSTAGAYVFLQGFYPYR